MPKKRILIPLSKPEKVTDTLLPTEPATLRDNTQDNIKIASAEEVSAYVGEPVTKITIDGDNRIMMQLWMSLK